MLEARSNMIPWFGAGLAGGGTGCTRSLALGYAAVVREVGRLARSGLRYPCVSMAIEVQRKHPCACACTHNT